MQIQQNLYNKLWEIVKNLHILDTATSRNALFVMAGFDSDLRKQLDVDGAPQIFFANSVEIICEYGTLHDGRDAFQSLLETIKELVGTEKRLAIDEIISTYCMQRQTNNAYRSNAIKKYLKSLIRKWETLDSPLLPSGFKFSSLAVSVKITLSNTDNSPDSSGTSLKKSSLIDNEVRIDDIWYTYPEKNRWVLLGDPGSGKTTSLIQTAARFAQKALAENTSLCPVFISLADFAKRYEVKGAFTLLDYISEIGHSLLIDNLSQATKKIIEEGSALFILDGWDEVPNHLKEDVSDAIKALSGYDEPNRILVSSRKIGYSSLPEYSIMEIAPLPLADQKKIMLAICGVNKTQRLLAEISNRSDIRRMAEVPMMLTVLSLVAREAEDFSTEYFQRYSLLFRFASKMLLDGRHRKGKGVKNPYKAEQILASISSELHKNLDALVGNEVLDSDTIENEIAKSQQDLAPWESTRDFLEDVSSKSNILYPINFLGQKYKYIHRTFREFFAALKFSQLSISDRQLIVSSLIADPNWSEVLVMLGGLVKDVEVYLRSLLKGPPDLALRTLREVKSLDYKLALDVLQLKPSRIEDRQLVFAELGNKIKSQSVLVDVVWSYLKASGSEVPRVDLYFIQSLLESCGSNLALELNDNIFQFLPKPNPHLLQDPRIILNQESYWCRVPEGNFVYGGGINDPAKPDWVACEMDINIGQFDIGRFAVSNLLYEYFDPAHFHRREFVDQLNSEDLDIHPVVNVSWYEAFMFCKWMAITFNGVRLPSEVEWEKAASWDGSKKRKFPWGNQWNPELLNNWEKGPNRTVPVNDYEDGRCFYGCYSMAGNVWEWCHDWFEDQGNYNLMTHFPDKPFGPLFGERKVDRGGGWYHDVGYPFTFIRAADNPSDIFSHCGFRMAKSGT